jgi:glycosyltransferase involved in cell wall biosynthesis
MIGISNAPPTRLGRYAAVNCQAMRLARKHHLEACFIHMAAKWAYRLWPTFVWCRLPVMMWYAHGTIRWPVRLAHRCVDRVATSTPQGFSIDSPKRRVIGQGVDVELFHLPVRPTENRRDDLLYVGRISQRKRVVLLIEMMAALRQIEPTSPIRLRVIGPVLTVADLDYDRQVRSLIWQFGLADRIDMVGFVPQTHIPDFYRTAFAHLNVSQTGSMDKTVLEALACGCPVMTSNPAFSELLQDHQEFRLDDTAPENLAQRVLALHRRQNSYNPQSLRDLIVGHHDDHALVNRLLLELRDIMRR